MFRQVRHVIAAELESEIAASNVRTLRAVTGRLAERGVTGVDTPIEHGTDRWSTLQGIVEDLRMPGRGFACVLDADGKVLCHPALDDQPELLGTSLAGERFERDDHEPVRLGTLEDTSVQTGRVVFGGVDTHFMATVPIGDTGARLLVHQPVSGLARISAAFRSQVLTISGTIGLAVVLLTGLTTWHLMRRHDRELEGINAGLEDQVAERVDQAIRFRDAMILGLAKLADYRDTDTGTHLERIAEYCEILSRELAARDPTIDEAYIQRLRVASAMHDIGKVGVADEVLLKPGPLTDAERARMQQHCVTGADTLIAIRSRMGHDELVEMSIVVALEHHERWDGTGYPLGLAGEQIQLAARIVAVADVYDALTSERPYKEAMTHDAACEIIEGGRESHFDPVVVDAFVAARARIDIVRRRLHKDALARNDTGPGARPGPV